MTHDAAVASAQHRLREDLDRLVAYGRGCPEEWGGVWFEGARLHVGFTRPDDHRAAVTALLEHPQDVEIVLVERSAQHLAAVRRAVERVLQEHPQSWTEVSTGRHVRVQLRAHGRLTRARRAGRRGRPAPRSPGG